MIAFEEHRAGLVTALLQRVAVQIPNRFRNWFRMAVDVHARLLVEESTGQMDLNSLGGRHDFSDEVMRIETEVDRVRIDVRDIEQPTAAGVP